MADVAVTCHYAYFDDTPAAGQVTFQARVPASSASGAGTRFIGAPIRFTLSAGGDLTGLIHPSDDPSMTPNGWTYRVVEEIVGLQPRQYDIVVPLAAVGAGINLATVAPAIPSDGDPTAFVTLTAFTALTARVTAVEARGFLSDVAATVTASGALVVGKHNPVDATSGAKVLTLANATAAGQLVGIEKVDATANAVTLSANLRGSASTIALSLAHESLVLVSKADGSWWPVSGHKTKSSLDALYQPLDADLTAIAALTTTTFGRSRLTEVDAPAALTAIGAQPLAAALTAIATLGVFSEHYNELDSSQATFPRSLATASGAVSMASQTLHLTYFTAVRTFTTTQAVILNGTAAAATPTLVRAGIYSVAANGDLTLVASFANDTTLFSVANTVATKNWTASLGLTAGQRYALGVLVVTAASAPALTGAQFGSALGAFANRLGRPPRMAGVVTGQADLPGTVANASVGNTGSRAWIELL